MSTAENLSEQPMEAKTRLRPPCFPFPAKETINVEEGYEGVAVLWYRPGLPSSADCEPGRPTPHKTRPWFQIALVLRGAGSKLQIRPPSRAVILIDFKAGFAVTPESVFPDAHAYLEHQKIYSALADTGPLHAAAPELHAELRAARLVDVPAVPHIAVNRAKPPPPTPGGVPGDCPIIT